MFVFAALGALLFAETAMAVNVLAHFMLQNTPRYARADWDKDVSNAMAIGIQGFILNIANGNDYQVQQIPTAFAAAEARGFKLAFSFDQNYQWDQNTMANVVALKASSSANFKWNNKILVSTFAGESKGNQYWADFKNLMSSKGIPITFAPAFQNWSRDTNQAQNLINSFPAIDGFCPWFAAWSPDNGDLVKAEVDVAYKNAIKGRSGPYIMAVSPWQFKDLGGDGWVQFSDTLPVYRWQQAIDTVKPDIVEIITWNDYAESHYLADTTDKMDLYDAANYVNGYSHAGWRTLYQYYISWYLTGVKPTITEDKIIYWYRTHPKAAQCSGGWRVRNSQYPSDAIFSAVMLSSPAKATIDIGLNNHKEWDAPSGVSINSVPFPSSDNEIPFFQLIRNNAVYKSGHGSKYVTKGCSWYNFNPFTGVL